MPESPKPESPKVTDVGMKRKSPGSTSGDPATETQIGKYLGRLVVEVYDPVDKTMGDGLLYQAYLVDGGDLHAIDQFVRKTVQQLYERLQKQKPF